ncbi:hypothetical protein BX600DRAFT_508985 [Xylariales sp. PMI_506]|nr:hypothetical protein BX600DRAFT_508985 [Xylariales sp. PMI_506]
MSGEHQSSSLGDPNAQPPTPKQTPTSLVFPSPVFQTPKSNQGSFEDTSAGWTPRFAEDYSVFNNTPGNLRSSHGGHVDFSISTPFRSSGHKRPLSAENIAVEIASHVNHFSPNPSLPLPPVDPSRRLQSSPESSTPSSGRQDTDSVLNSQQRTYKKSRQESAPEILVQGQTATPPPSARKGVRKLAPKLQTTMMQNEHGYGQEFVVGTPQQHNNMQAFITTPTDMFSYPMSAPATAPVFTDTRPFWDNDAGMSGMELDFSAGAPELFQTAGHRPMNSIDWARSNEMFQETGVMPPLPQQNQEGNPSGKRERPLAPKPPANNPTAVSQDTSMFGTSFGAPMDDPFGMMNQGGGVDPGLLFTRPPSSGIQTATFDHMAQAPLIQQPMPQVEIPTLPSKVSQRGGLRRVSSTKEISSTKKMDRAPASSPTKSSARPGLSRSFSDNRGRRPAHRASLPALAPSARPSSQQAIGSRPGSQSSRTSGRISPLKNHHRLSSLSSIPESNTPRTRTSVKFTIDPNGRARAETTMEVVEGQQRTPTGPRGRKTPKKDVSKWSSSDDDGSSTDDEPIVIPSRNTSFVLPDPNKPTSTHPFRSARRSMSEQSNSSLGIFYNDPDSEAETEVAHEAGSGRGDATSELRKVVEDRQKRISLSTSQRFVSGLAHSGASTISPTALTDGSLPTPPSRGNLVRCVCNRAESPRNSDGLMVQCESCENWLHGKCTNISQRTLPSVYICAFCANTPNAHGLRGRSGGRNTSGPARRSNMSPLAHKSFKSFR